MAKIGFEVITLLARNIQTARKRMGLTQEELADKIGVKRAALASWETRRSKPDVDDFMKLCSSLKTKPEDLSGFSFEEKLSGFQQPVIDLAIILANLPPSVFPMIRKMILSLSDEVNGDKTKE